MNEEEREKYESQFKQQPKPAGGAPAGGAAAGGAKKGGDDKKKK
jgi:hypothetical protein